VSAAASSRQQGNLNVQTASAASFGTRLYCVLICLQGYAEETQEFEAGISNAKYFK
jgi:hypothetical protein